MKKVLRFIFICIAPFLMCAECSKSKVLPDSTQTGQQTFGCTVNGVIFSPNTIPGSGFERLGANYGPSGTGFYTLSIRAGSKNTSENISIAYKGKNLNSGDKIPLSNSSTQASAIYSKSGIDFNIDSPLSGELDITNLDQNSKIISGTFYFDAVDANGNKINIRSGVFDLTYL